MTNGRLTKRITVFLLRVGMLTVPLFLANVPLATAQTPTKEIVEKVMKKTWDKTATSTNPKAILTLNSVKFGKSYKATVQEVQVGGIPDKGVVTPALVDFTVRNYHSNATNAVRREREVKVYKDKFDEWAVMITSARGQDTTTKEPAVK